MDALKALSDINLKVSEVRNALSELQEAETEYLVAREKKAMQRIAKVLEESEALVDQASENYQEVRDLAHAMSEAAAFFVETEKVFQGLLTDFNERSQEWDATVLQQEEQLANARKTIETDRIIIKNDRESIEQTKANLLEDKRRVEDGRETVQRAINRLKEGRI